MKNTNIIKLNQGEDKILSFIQQHIDEGDYISALKLLRRRNSLYEPNADSYSLTADIYEQLDLSSEVLNAWYHVLDLSYGEEDPDIYEEIALNYYNIGQENAAAYYYNKLLDENKSLDKESKLQIVKMFSQEKKSNIKIVYPPEKADYTENINDGLDALKSGNSKKAIELFSAVNEVSDNYNSAQNLLAVSYLLDGSSDKAEKICKELIEKDENDVQALSTYAAVLGERKERDKAKEIAKRLFNLKDVTTEDEYKIATVCCENGLHEEALQLFNKLEKEIPYDKILLYFKAVAAFNCGAYQVCLDSLDKLLLIYPKAYVAKYYRVAVQKFLEQPPEQKEPPVLTYFYRVPSSMREKFCTLLISLNKLNKKQANLLGCTPEVEKALEWCMDEDEMDLQMMSAIVAVHIEEEDFLRELLLDYTVADVIKVQTLKLIAERNEEKSYSVTICDIFRKIDFKHIQIGVKKHKRFISAYAQVYSKFVIIEQINAEKICRATEDIYQALMISQGMDLANDEKSLACAIYLMAGLKEAGIAIKKVCAVFDAKEETVKRILIASGFQKKEEENSSKGVQQA